MCNVVHPRKAREFKFCPPTECRKLPTLVELATGAAFKFRYGEDTFIKVECPGYLRAKEYQDSIYLLDGSGRVGRTSHTGEVIPVNDMTIECANHV